MSENADSQNKFRNEIARKILHMCSFLIVIFIYFVDKKTACIVIGALLVLLFAANTLLLSSRFQIINDFKVKYFSFLLRDDEKHGYISSNWFLLGCFLSVLLFPKYVAMLGITVLIFGDAFAAIIGVRFGKHKFKNGKSLEGTLGFIVVSYLFLTAFMLLLPDAGISFAVASFIAIPIVAVAEIYSKQIKIDDNLVIPIVFGVLTVVLMKIFEMSGLFV
ncbi:Phytol kinase [Methanimicrococcus hongohii]|uniref:Phytol kinase n=1 Tax=Methanimicrococcus hongohii TaxID=3028295 RepID=A0AA96V9S7_9EURY|nr:SEC59/DGK1/VTE5 family protein [Methanimicrococcus sp. Hf6]WNY24106.1 Phytol kinase [Methanimicrococcus sp. Hf6]